MSSFCFNEHTYHTVGELPKIGQKAPDFTLTNTDLGEIHLKDLLGKKLILNIFPSIDTNTCAASIRAFNTLAEQFEDFHVYGISVDLPFAQERFCHSEKINKVTCTSVFRHPEFGINYGVLIEDGPLKGLLARSVIVINEKGKIVYTQFVDDIIKEPDYDAIIHSLEK